MKFRWPGIQNRVLLIRNGAADAYAMRMGGLVREAAFRLEDLELFKGYCQSRARSKFTVLTDLVEEDFRIETIPFVIGSGRRQLLARKYDQAYRTTPYRASISLGREVVHVEAKDSKRRDEQVLLMALTNQQAINPWLEVMHEQRAQVRGVHSLPVVTRWVNQYLGSEDQTALFVTLTRAGLRQVFIYEGRPRFSRLASFTESAIDRAGERVESEISRTEQYLATLRWLPRDAGPLRAILVAPVEARSNWQMACVNTDRLAFEFPDLREMAQSLGIRPDQEGAQEAALRADSLWAAGALRFPSKVDFSPDWVREHYTQWRWRTAIVGAGAALCAAGTASGALFLAQAAAIDSDADRQAANSARANAEYQKVAKTFPQIGVTPEHLRGVVLALDPYALRPVTPEPLLIQVSRALLAVPAFALAKIEWQVSESADAGAGTTTFLRPRAPAVAGASGVTPGSERFEIMVLTGALAGERTATPRRKIVAAKGIVDAVKLIPGVEVTPLRLPMDFSPTGNFKGGDDEDAVTAETEPIVLRVVRKVGT